MMSLYQRYLFAYFANTDRAESEQVRFAVSAADDPLSWIPLAGGSPILVSDVGEHGARDPFIVRDDRTGRFHLLATDLRTLPGNDWERAVRWGSRSILIWDSEDLVHWRRPRLAQIAPDGAGNTWAPKAVWSAEFGEWLVLFASSLYAEDEDRTQAAYQRILVVRTKDFQTFSPPNIYLDRGHDVIDATFLDTPGAIYRFSADSLTNEPGKQLQHVSQERGRSILDPNFQVVRHGVGADAIARGEGPAPFRGLADDGWYLLVDEFELRGYQLFHSDDPGSGDWRHVPTAHLPVEARHGSVTPITLQEHERLLEAFGTTDRAERAVA